VVGHIHDQVLAHHGQANHSNVCLRHGSVLSFALLEVMDALYLAGMEQKARISSLKLAVALP